MSGAMQRLAAAHLALVRSVLARGRNECARAIAHAEGAARLAPRDSLDVARLAWYLLAAARTGAGVLGGAIQA